MNADRWMKMQRNVTLVSYAMLASFWLSYTLTSFWWLGLLMLVYQGQGFWESMKADTADERAELIAARAGFLSQKLMLGSGMLVFSLDRWIHLNVAWCLISVLLVGSLSEMAFRKWLGAEPQRRSSMRLLGVIVAISGVLLAAGLVYLFWWNKR